MRWAQAVKRSRGPPTRAKVGVPTSGRFGREPGRRGPCNRDPFTDAPSCASRTFHNHMSDPAKGTCNCGQVEVTLLDGLPEDSSLCCQSQRLPSRRGMGITAELAC